MFTIHVLSEKNTFISHPNKTPEFQVPLSSGNCSNINKHHLCFSRVQTMWNYSS